MKTALITGASSGIGAEYARQLASSGKFNLILVARRLERLNELKREVEERFQASGFPRAWVRVFSVDLVNPAKRGELLRILREEGHEVDLLVNNAGFGSVAPFLETDPERLIEMVELNDVVPLVLTRHLLPGMIRRGSGAVINVSSTASFQPMPHMAVYAATKAFLTSFSLALFAELRESGVTVLTHCPGPTRTEFHLVSGLPEKMTFIPSAEVTPVVKEALEALGRRRPMVVNGGLNSLIAFVARLTPPALSARLVEVVLRRKSAVRRCDQLAQ